ncbi:F-box domain-containing protein [Clohesyomyces aquaticus]|uniref:F-box domain-containing protein n=1 Tax=Clohesyomyces aquaticus TaxID=1231657 RepID=A0A1Y1ZSE2_9PLEO|nr:F-box domain-containing protein [Clohesyomyces aquaticus]
MTITLDRLPFDVLFYVTSSLQFDDIINLSRTCRQLRILLNENTLCRRTIEAHVPHSKEAKLAQDNQITYGEAVQSVHERREAFSNAFPFSARMVGEGTAFTYRQGVLCILYDITVRVSDEHSSSGSFIIDLSHILGSLSESSTGSSSEMKISLLYYSDEILAIYYGRKTRPNNGRILAISTRKEVSDGQRLIEEIQLETTYKLFVRHTASYLYYGTYTGLGDHGHHEWEISGVSLDEKHPLPKRVRPLQLGEFYGMDIGNTVAFEIIGGYFYALSNQTSFEVEEIDWTSFYHLIRFPLDQPLSDFVQINPRVYRRQHKEGPIHDSWTNLTIQTDELTNKPFIVEARREWLNSSSRQLRTFYISDIKFEEKKLNTSSENSPDPPMLPTNDVMAPLIDSSNNPHWAPEQPRFNWNAHPEFGPGCKPARSFIFSKTKYRGYNFSCSSFIDLVEDERCCNDPSAGPCLRIRIGSRRPAPIDWEPSDKNTPTEGESVSPPPKEDDEFRHSSIKMWPPPAGKCPCSKRLHQILNPPVASGSVHNKTITGAMDERTFVYMVRQGRSYSADDESTPGSVVVISFNRETRDVSTQNSLSSVSAATEKAECFLSDSHWSWQPGHACRAQDCR